MKRITEQQKHKNKNNKNNKNIKTRTTRTKTIFKTIINNF